MLECNWFNGKEPARGSDLTREYRVNRLAFIHICELKFGAVEQRIFRDESVPSESIKYGYSEHDIVSELSYNDGLIMV